MPKTLKGQQTNDQFEQMVIRALKDLNATSPERKVYGKVIKEHIIKHGYWINSIGENSFQTYLSDLASKNKSVAIPEGQKGYYLKEETPFLEALEMDPLIVDSVESSEQTDLRTRKTQREKLLYPAVFQWLKSSGFRAKDVSDLKNGGPWGNPDIVGMIYDENFFYKSFEIVSIEVKITIKDWERSIFEAISHKRFADRSYFCFAAADVNVDIQSYVKTFKDYSERYKIGILVCRLSNDKYAELIQSSTPEINADEIDVIEIIPAPYDEAPTRLRSQFLSRLEIRTTLDFTTVFP